MNFWAGQKISARSACSIVLYLQFQNGGYVAGADSDCDLWRVTASWVRFLVG